ncbi:MAG TPA: hypothetical protein VJQ46_00115 [Gemmatimonadales bacterium]|nr:hypothetical protein [Gemmatimonadales bacterium]
MRLRSNQAWLRALIGAGSSILALGCVDSTGPRKDQAGHNTGSSADLRINGVTADVDDEFALASRTSARGFAGFYVREDGRFIVEVSEAGDADAAIAFAVAKHGSRSRSRSPMIQRVKYSFAELKAWADQLSAALTDLSGWQLDVDERTNRLWVGASTKALRDSIRRVVLGSSIPLGAVTFEIAAMPEPRLTLVDRAPSMQGGFQTINENGATCSLGFNAISNGQQIFVIASHCSRFPASLDSRPLYQPGFQSAGNIIGSEVKDIPYATDAYSASEPFCKPFGVVSCRWSDASYFRYNAGVSVDQGYIAWTLGEQGTNGYRTIDPAKPRVRVSARLLDSQAAVGDSMKKVGHASGRSSGVITRRCVTIAWPGVGGNLLCQYISTIYSTGGDSGSPIFEYTGGVNGEAHLHGVLWGGPTNDPNTTYYSPLSGIERDLGPISVCSPPATGC